MPSARTVSLMAIVVSGGLHEEHAQAAAIAQRIGRRWRQAGLAHWAAVACDWAARFEGIEQLAGEPRLAPMLAVWRLALRYARSGLRPADAQVAIALARLRFARWQARWPAWACADGRSRRWDPLQQGLGEFCALGTEPEALIVWEGARPTVPLRQAVAFLLAHASAATAAP